MSKGTRNIGIVVVTWFVFTSAMQYSLGAGHTSWWTASIIGGVAGGILGLLLVYLQESASLDGQMKENDWYMKMWAGMLGHPEATSWKTLKDALDADKTHLPPVQA